MSQARMMCVICAGGAAIMGTMCGWTRSARYPFATTADQRRCSLITSTQSKNDNDRSQSFCFVFSPRMRILFIICLTITLSRSMLYQVYVGTLFIFEEISVQEHQFLYNNLSSMMQHTGVLYTCHTCVIHVLYVYYVFYLLR